MPVPGPKVPAGPPVPPPSQSLAASAPPAGLPPSVLKVGSDLMHECDVFTTAVAKQCFAQAGKVVMTTYCESFVKGFCKMGLRCVCVHPRKVNRPLVVRVFLRNDFREFWDLTVNQFHTVCRPNTVLARDVAALVEAEGQAWRIMCGRYVGDTGCRSDVCSYIHADVEQLNQLQKEKAAEPQTTRVPDVLPPPPSTTPTTPAARLPIADAWPTALPPNGDGMVVGERCPAFMEGYCPNGPDCRFLHPKQQTRLPVVRLALGNHSTRYWDVPFAKLRDMAKPSQAVGAAMQMIKKEGQASHMLCGHFVAAEGNCWKEARCNYVHVNLQLLGTPKLGTLEGLRPLGFRREDLRPQEDRDPLPQASHPNGLPNTPTATPALSVSSPDRKSVV